MSKRLNNETSPDDLQRSKMPNEGKTPERRGEEGISKEVFQKILDKQLDIFTEKLFSTEKQKISQGKEENESQPAMLNAIKTMLDNNARMLQAKIEETEANIKEAMQQKIGALERQVADLSTANHELNQRVEKLEREQRRKKIVITGIDCQTKSVAAGIKEAMKNAGGTGVDLQDVREIKTNNNKTKFLATCATLDDKQMVMLVKRKLKLDGKPIYINDDLTPEEQAVQYKARLFANEQRTSGKKAAVAYRKVWIEGVCHQYDEEVDMFLKN